MNTETPKPPHDAELVARLRDDDEDTAYSVQYDLQTRAADEIERLGAEVIDLRCRLATTEKFRDDYRTLWSNYDDWLCPRCERGGTFAHMVRLGMCRSRHVLPAVEAEYLQLKAEVARLRAETPKPPEAPT